jgi:hypothetical protein
MLTEQEVIRLAKQAAQQQGWAWIEPARATLRRAWRGNNGRWEVYSNAQGRGATARIVIDAVTGHVLEKGYIPR